MRIVIVEDEIRIREGICKLITKIDSNYDVAAVAVNGLEGYNLITELKPDVVITDIMMPEMNGLEMLERLKEQGNMPKAIVLSAYSEFSYAQAAIRLGVSEYLIKPVTIKELTGSLSKLKKILSSDSRVPATLGSLDNIFMGLVNESIIPDEILENYLVDRYGMNPKLEFIEIVAYLGYYYDENVALVRKNIEQMIEMYPGVSGVVLEIPREMTLLTIVYNYDKEESFERWIQNQIRINSVAMKRVCLGMIMVDGLRNIQSSYRLINCHLDWNMIFGSDVLITFPKVTKMHAIKSIYPIEIENRMKVAMCSSDNAATLNEVKKFEDYFFDGQLYDPKDIKEAYTRFIWAALAIGKELVNTGNQELSQKQLIQRIEDAKSSIEMLDILDFVFRELLQDCHNDEHMGLTVKRTIKLVHEFYRDGITLDEIASKLNITPEYLSAQFQKEVGVNFSSYIRNYRIGKAKMLLVGSDMKVYEIAQEVGYQDSKYFSRVFRQVTGQKPDEFRKSQR